MGGKIKLGKVEVYIQLSLIGFFIQRWLPLNTRTQQSGEKSQGQKALTLSGFCLNRLIHHRNRKVPRKYGEKYERLVGVSVPEDATCRGIPSVQPKARLCCS